MINQTEFKVVGYKTVHTKNGDMVVLSGTFTDDFTTGLAVSELWLGKDDKAAFDAISDAKKIGTVCVCSGGYTKNGIYKQILNLNKFKV